MSGSPPHHFPPYESTSREASRWIAKLERGLREDEGEFLQAWLKVPRHRDTIVEIARLWHGPEVNSILRLLVPTAREPGTPKQRKQTVTLPMVFALVSTTGLLVMLFTHHGRANGFDPIRNVYRSGNSEMYITGIGERRDIQLIDGTRITLNTGTRLSVTFHEDSRDIDLWGGEASFDVPQSMGRPFYVSAGHRRFEGSGTSFNLRIMTPSDVALTVTNGNVKVLDAPARMPESMARRRDRISYGEAIVKPYEEALVAPGFQSVGHIEPSEVGTRMAWKHGVILCSDAALEDLLAEVERYTSARFVLADEKLRNLRVSGSFRTGNVNAVRRTLRQNFEIGSHQNEQGQIVLTPLVKA